MGRYIYIHVKLYYVHTRLECRDASAEEADFLFITHPHKTIMRLTACDNTKIPQNLQNSIAMSKIL